MLELQTLRLRMRPVTMDDLDKLFELRSDPETMRFMDGPHSREKVEERLRFYLEHHARHGFGVCAMYMKTGSEMIGWSGLQYLEDTPDVEVGYGMSPPFWGKGIATEAAAAWLRFGFEIAKLERIVAVADHDNIASRHVMEKLGMVYEKDAFFYNHDVAFYSIARARFQRRDSVFIIT